MILMIMADIGRRSERNQGLFSVYSMLPPFTPFTLSYQGLKILAVEK